jgi:hypothetical protein
LESVAPQFLRLRITSLLPLFRGCWTWNEPHCQDNSLSLAWRQPIIGVFSLHKNHMSHFP